MVRNSLDQNIRRPQEMESYLAAYGWHFNRKASDYAARHMKKSSNGGLVRIEPYTAEAVDAMLKSHGVQLENDVLHDKVYVANMCKADFMGSSIMDELHMARYIKDVLDDPDAGDGTVMRRWYAGMVAAGMPVDWEALL